MYRKENNLKECKRLFMAEKEQRKRPLSLKDLTEGIACPLFYTVIGCFLVLLHRLSVSPIQFAAVLVLSLLLECERRKKKDPGRRLLVNWRPVSSSLHVYIYVIAADCVFYNRKRNQTSVYIMSAVANTFENVKAVILSAHKNTTSRDKVSFYNSWAENYDQDVAVLDYRAPTLAANCISSHFSGDREGAVVLDVACGTGLVATQLKKLGFGKFVGVDGSKAMLELARQSGLYQDSKQVMLGEEPLPIQWVDSFDVVVIVGGLSFGHVPPAVVRDLCKSTKPGGYICMTTRSNQDNLEYKGFLDSELRQMENEGLWTCVEVTEVENWERAVSEHEDGYISGAVYLYKKL
ncbi:methyltransferase-like protein 27 isoform X2 [Neolamprologus brichardi]|uniref:methyltransferase-like protein 27 isoform X2 n=1 Tax=Neolamprologus brichardi TaxID=32507 RepID=UPI0003EC6201|nr:methyltransferase-like protein 27 isoform X2 [Neolamprologus brichardi]